LLEEPAAHSTTSSLTRDSRASTSDGICGLATSDSVEDFEGLEEDSNFSGPRYIARRPVDHGLLMADIEEDENEEGDGGDSDEEGEDCALFDDAACEALLENDFPSDESNAVLDTPKKNEVLMLKDGMHSQLKVPGAPLSWKPKACATAKGEPEFGDVDNPGKWSEFTFRAEFDTKGKYKRHSIPTGAMPVPLKDGKRKIGEWEFFYDKWKSTSDTPGRTHATDENPFPDERKGCLDAVQLEKLGLTKKRMKACDALFFWQLLLPIGDPKKSGVLGDGRKPFYHDVVKWTNLYAATEFGMDGTYGHKFHPVTLKDIVNWEGIVTRDGVRGGGGALHRRWDVTDSDYDDLIFKTMSFTRFLQIKRSYKLCNNFASVKRSEPNFDPAWKYDRIYKVLIYNVNGITERAGLDLCGDETSWGFGGFGEQGTGLVGNVKGKPGVSKGGQTVLITDCDRLRPRAYVHRHKMHEKPIGWNKQGPNEVRMIMEKINQMVVGEGTANVRKIFTEKPHSTWDNHFSGDHVMDWLGMQGLGATMTCRRDRICSGVAEKYLCKKKTDTKERSRAARFNQRITMVKTVKAGRDHPKFERVHVTFQSTSSCNLSTVNALQTNRLFVAQRERGRGEYKRWWGIEMNQARELYLKTYGVIDTLDKYVSSANFGYRSWKYWHAPMNHAKAMVAAVAYDMYKECAEGNLDSDWKLAPKEVASYHKFRDILSKQLLQWDPAYQMYPGDSGMRRVTQMKKSRRRTELFRQVDLLENYEDSISLDDFKKGKDGENSRLCGDLCAFRKHCTSVIKQGSGGRGNHALKCQSCGQNCYTLCGLCQDADGRHPPVCFNPLRGKGKGKQCFLDYHNDLFFGLAHKDSGKVLRRNEKDWLSPTSAKRVKHAQYMYKVLEAHANSPE
jgi:hypothetical protein